METIFFLILETNGYLTFNVGEDSNKSTLWWKANFQLQLGWDVHSYSLILCFSSNLDFSCYARPIRDGSIYHATNCSLLIKLFLKLHLIEELEEEGMRKELCVPLSIGGATIV